MRALSLRGLGRGAVFLLPACAAAWAAGCSDDAAGVAPDGADAATDAASDVVRAPDGSATKRDCATDLDADGLWKHLECSGLYASFADKTIAATAKPYKPGVEFWSDGAEKARWVFLPEGSKIDISDWDEWKYPKGTKVWKEFKLGGKRIETRLFTKLADSSWVHTSYRWNADESDAVRNDGGEKIPGLGPDGGTYEIPNAGQCEKCHFGRKDQLLGLDAVSLGLASATGETLAVLAAAGRLSATPPSTSLAFPGGAAGSAAVGWLHANCGACHNANSNAAARIVKVHFLVRASQLAPADGGAAATLQKLDVYAQGHCINANLVEPGPGATPYKFIRGGSPSRSLVSILSGRRVAAGEEPNGAVQMPPIVTRAVDTVGHKQVDDWITTLPACP